MKKSFDILKKCELFEGIGTGDIPEMLSCLGAWEKQVSKQQMIIEEGEPARMVGIVLSGSVQIVQDDYYGNRSIVAMIEPGQLFGETFACANVDVMPVSVIASADSRVMLINCLRIIKTCSNSCEFHNRLVFNLMRLVAEKNLVFQQKIEITSKRTTIEKLMAYLMRQAKNSNSNSFRIPYDRQGLADYLGVERSALSAEIGKMRKEGMIECKRSDFTLLRAKIT